MYKGIMILWSDTCQVWLRLNQKHSVNHNLLFLLFMLSISYKVSIFRSFINHSKFAFCIPLHLSP